MARTWVGTSGWQYRHWRGRFYPDRMAQHRWFEHYAEHFATVELNNTFYRQPKDEAWRAWERHAPAGFRYAVKAHRYITHLKRLIDVGEPMRRFYAAAEQLGEHLGPALFQLPPDFDNTPEHRERLARMLALLPEGRAAVEFRHESWFNEEVFAMLHDFDVALCIADWKTAKAPRVATASFVYWRFHGPSGRYAGSYSDGMLRRRAKWIAEVAGRSRESWVFFNNDDRAFAVENALQLDRMLAAHGGRA